ncbi:beta-alanine-activating enzyme [Notolabrus celidotus]|uniref:beta-alanine-activating enzyme n=1 Tax=Notolabrus celidotus TaxID=1203425 RepID=UPI00148F7D08|nr:beta-alanine-activating enzyme [Notolabrus celidotus]
MNMAVRTLQDLVSAAASLHADRAAVTYDSGSLSWTPESLRYGELVDLAAELTADLRETCSDNNGMIGLFCCSDLFIPVWILGILQTPAAYVPLDPESPGLLSARVMNQCGLKYCAVKTDMLQRFQETLFKHVSVEVCAELPKFKVSVVQLKMQPDPKEVSGLKQSRDRTAEGAAAALKEAGHADLAYVLHTSGTTGVPKTVRVPHRCILPNILHLRSLFQMSEEDVVFLASPLTFDPSVVDLFLALSSGAQLLIVSSVMKKMPRRLAQLLFTRQKTTVLQVTPTLLVRFGEQVLRQEVLSSFSSLRVLALGGEACPSLALLRSWKHEGNKTRIYNIYGITEVSCWACVYEVPESHLHPHSLASSSVPLGTPLMDTSVEVRDEVGHVVTEGEGQVFIGGEERVCLLDDEDVVVPGTKRATGDWVNVKDKQLFYLGRRDRMIKRNGKRVNLENLQQLIQSLPEVEACAVCLHKASRLLAFVVASTSGEQTSASEQEPVGQSHQDQTRLPSPAEQTSDLSRRILDRLSLLVPSHSVPDTLVLVPALSLTHHGKVDLDALKKMYQKQRRSSGSSFRDFTKLKRNLESLWKETLGLPEDEPVEEDSNFLLSGGDSLKALLLCEDVLAAAGGASPELLEVILDGSFSEVLQHVERMTATLPHKSETSPLSDAKKRPAGAPSAAPAKRGHTERRQEERRGFRVLRRAGAVMESKHPETDVNSEEEGALELSLSWSSDTGRCVDASPVLLVTDTKTTVFIGSHSHRIQALDLTTGSLLWERVLGDRIEASAAVSRCGSLVVIGCYDGCVYFLCAASGETRWVYKTGDAVKSCPAVDPVTGSVMVGSHDGHVYALNPEVEQCMWRRHSGGGAVFSSPYLLSSLRRLYVASLGGQLLCLSADSGEVLWSLCRDVPFFSSPNGSSGQVMIGSVDGNICCFSEEGKLVWTFQTGAPVFSSPCVTPDQQSVLCGSHDGRLYCLNQTDGSLVWTFQTTGKVYSSPCVFDGSVLGLRRALVAVASTDGAVWILDGHDGRMLTKFTLQGELFSSPVVCGRYLVLGCRNDFVYCLKLSLKEENKLVL